MAATLTLTQPPSLNELADSKPIALFLDFDGTLVPIAPEPDAINVKPGLGPSLERLARQHGDRLAVVSGRSIADLANYIGNPAIAIGGSHGAERKAMTGEVLGTPDAIPAEARAAAASFASNLAGVLLERKTHGVALHYREAPGAVDVVETLANELADKHDLTVKRGKYVVELVPKGASKAEAVKLFMAKPRFEGSVPIFLGDDVTDEDGFAAAEELGGFGIQVGVREPTLARYRLSDVAATHEWLGL